MCEFQVKALESNNSDPMAYQRGDIIACYPDGSFKSPTSLEYLAISVPDMPFAEGELLTQPVMSTDTATGEQIMTVRRMYVCVENIKPENQAAFYAAYTTGTTYVTNRMDFLSFSVEEKA